jgi:hypothetical protein
VRDGDCIRHHTACWVQKTTTHFTNVYGRECSAQGALQLLGGRQGLSLRENSAMGVGNMRYVVHTAIPIWPWFICLLVEANNYNNMMPSVHNPAAWLRAGGRVSSRRLLADLPQWTN